MVNFNVRLITVFLASFFFTTVTLGNPVLGNVGSGNVVVQQTSNTTTINQSSQKAILNWQSFNIGAGEKTQFFQPTNGIALNRISPTQGASQIFGMLTATGRIILINPAGIYFGPNSYVNVGGLIATTSNITNQNFLSGKYIFNQASPFDGASILNQGTIIAAKHGLISLVGQNVTNNGLIQANLGKVVLASGDAFTVDFMGDGMVNFAVDKKSSSRAGSVTNTGSLIANGGSVLVTAQQASGVLDNVINLKGVIEAKSVYKKKGEIIISGDPNGGVVNIAANINASGNAKAKGGKVKITGYNILLDSPTNINVSGKSGGSINVGGNYQGKGPLPNANAVIVKKDATLNANALTNGKGGKIIVWSDNYTNVMGNIFAMGGSEGGNGGFVETSSHNLLSAINANVNTSAANGSTGTWLLDPANVTINAADSGYTNTANVFTPNSGVANVTINTATLATALLTNNITITTTNSGTDGGQVGNITVSNPISWASGNSLTLTAANNILINAGITIGNSAAAQLILNATGNVTQSAAITGSGQLVKQGAGTFIASQANSYTGDTTITSGTLQAGAANALSANSAINLANTAGATLDLNNFNNSIRSLSGGGTTGGNVTLGSGTLTIANSTNGSNTSYAGVISGTGGLTVNLTGTTASAPTQILSGNNTYTGTTTINAGRLAAQSNGALGQSNGGAINIVANGSVQSQLVLDGISTLTNTNTITLSGNGNVGDVQLRSINATATLSNPISLTNTTQFSTSAPSLILNGAVTGTGSLIIRNGSSSATVQLSNNGNTYSGGTTILEGTLAATAAGALGSGAINITAFISPVTLDLTALSSLTNTNTITIGSDFNQSQLNTSAGITLSNAINITGSTNNFFNVAANTTILSGPISGSGVLIKNGAGTLQFNGTSNTYSGATIINAGTLRANAVNALSGNSAINLVDVAGATLDLNNFNNSIRSLSGGGTTGGNVSLGSGTLTIANADVASSTSYDGVISGTGGLTIDLTDMSSPTQTLSGTNTYTGTTTINSGTLSATSVGALGPASGGNIVIAPSASSTAILDISTLASLTNTNGSINLNSSAASSTAQIDTTTGITLPNAVSLTGTANTFNVSANTTILSGAITGTGDLTKTGAGILQFNGTSNTYSGTTNINAGILRANAVNALSGNSAINLVDVAGATLDLNNLNNNIRSLSGGGTTGGNVSLGSGTLTIANADASSSTSYDGVISGTGGLTLNLTGTGTPTQTLTNTNTYLGDTNINSGTLVAAVSGALSTGVINIAASASATAVLDLTALSSFGNTNTINLDSSAASSIAQLKTSPTITLSNAIGLTGTANNFDVAANTTTLNGVISGTGGLTKSGAGILIIGGNNNYAGGTTVNDGSLNVTNTNGLGTGVINIAPSASATAVLDLTALSSLGNTNTINLDSSAASSAAQLKTSPTITLANAIGLTGTDNTFDVAANTTTLNGVISGTGGFSKSGDGILVIGGNNNYAGGTTVNDGTVSVTHTNGLGTGVVNLAPTTGQDVTLDLTALSSLGNTNTINLNSSAAGSSVTFATSLTITLANAIGLTGTDNTFDVAANTTTLNGVISGTGGYSKSGSGILIIGGNNTYAGTTTVDAGTLQVANASGLGSTAGDTIVNSGTTLTLAGVNVGGENITLDNATLNGSGTSGSSSAVVLVDGTTNNINSSSGNLTLSGVVSGTGVTIDKDGAGKVTLANNGNTYTGITNINDGTLAASESGALGDSVVNITPNAGNTAVLDLSAISSLTNPNAINFDSSAAGSTAQLLTTNTITLANAISLTGTDNEFNVTANTTTLNGVISGNGYTKLGDGILIIGGANTYTGTTIVDAGTLQIANALGLGTTAGDTIINSGATLTLAGVNIGGENITLNGSTLNGTGTSGLTGTITLGNSTDNIISANSGNMILGGAIDGNADLTLQGSGNLILGADIGSGTPLNNLTIDTLLNLAANVALTATNIDINNGVSGAGLDLAVNGHDIAISGPVSLNNLSFTGTGSNNSLAIDAGNPQTWTLTGADSGTIDTSGIISGLFNNIQNIIGGSGGNNFVLGGGTLAGDITGGSGNNTVFGGSGALVWNIIGVDTITVTGIGGILHNMQNLVGGSAGNQFIFANNSKITGSINGGSMSGSNINTLNFQNYTHPVSVTLTNNKFNGSAVNNTNQNIVSYTNINDLVGNPSMPSKLTPTANQLNQVVITGPTSGYIGDPLTWTGFLVAGATPPVPPPVITGPDVSQIIEQGDTDKGLAGNSLITFDGVDQNISDIQDQAAKVFDRDLNKVVINPYCNATF